MTFAQGEDFTYFTVKANADAEDEDHEKVVLGFGPLPEGVSTGENTQATVTIKAPVRVSFEASSYTATEGGASAEVTVRLNEPAPYQNVIPLTAEGGNGADSGDWSGVPQDLTFDYGDISKTFTVHAVDDTVEDDGEMVKLGFGTLPVGFMVMSPTTATVTIMNDDGTNNNGVPISVTVKPTKLAEGESARVSVTTDDVTYAADQTIELRFSGTAGAADYAVTSGGRTLISPYQIILPAGKSAVSASITALRDDDDLEAAETLTVTAYRGEEMIGGWTITISPCGGTGQHTSWMSIEGDADVDYRRPFTVRVCFCAPTEDLALDQPFGSTVPRATGLGIVPPETWSGYHNGQAYVPATMSNVREIVQGHIWLVDVRAHVAPDVLPGKTGKWRLVFLLGDGSKQSPYSYVLTVDLAGPLQQSPGKQLAREVRLSRDTLTVNEGDTEAYMVALGSRPTTDVTIYISGHSNTDLTLSPDTLKFTPDNWDVPQSVTVSATEDGDTATNVAVELTHTADGGYYTSLTIATEVYGYKPHPALSPHLEPIEEPSLTVNITERAENSETSSRQQTARSNSPATGGPTISGAPRVGRTLTASTSRIEDADGLTNAIFSYQWISDDWATDTEIQGATESTYTLVAADSGKAIKVRVTFTDDAGNEETLVSYAVAAPASEPEGQQDSQTESQPPPKPQNLTANAGNGSITLAWDAPDDDSVTGYQILRRRPTMDEDTLLVYVGDTGSTRTTFTDTDLTAGVRHVYRVKAINDAGLSEWSNFARAVPSEPKET